MSFYEKTSQIECSLEALYEFHTNIKNLQAISPEAIKVTFLDDHFLPKEGAVMSVKTVKNFIPMLWKVRIDKMQAPHLLIDVAVKSPFKSWKHSHLFTQIDEKRCELKDIVEYTLPFGFIGSLFDCFIQKELQAMFTFRHLSTKKLLEEK